MNKQELLENFTTEELAEAFLSALEDIANFDDILNTVKNLFIGEDLIISNVIKNEDGEKTNTVRFENIKSFAQYIKCLNNFNINFIENATNPSNRNIKIQKKIQTPKELNGLEDTIKELEQKNKALKQNMDEMLAGFRKGIEPYTDLVQMHEIIEKLENEIKNKEQVIRQMDSILDRLFGVKHDIVESPDEFEKIPKQKVSDNETVLDFLPDEPIEVAGMLVNIHKRTLCENAAYYQKMFDVPKLRQIARHLLVYCNANGNKKNG